jgi:hypothetical protein
MMTTQDAIQVETLVDCRPTNMRIYEKRQASFYASVALAVDRRVGFVFSVEAGAPAGEAQLTAAAARQALEIVREQAPAARVTFAVRQDRVAAALTAAFADEQVTVVSTRDFARWDEAYVSADERMGTGAGVIPHLWRGDITEAEVACFHDAAARF